MGCKSISILTATLVSCALVLTSCQPKKDSDTGGSGKISVTGLSSIVGIYDWSDDYGVDGIDEWYLEIDSDGYISDYDYQGDSYDLGDNCYDIDFDYEKLTHISGNTFSSINAGTVTVTSNGGGGITLASSEFPGDDIILGEKTTLVSSDLLAANCINFTAAPQRSSKLLNRGKLEKPTK